MKLSIVIPAYNEEKAIAAIIERCLAAREVITRESPVREVEIIVVSDGSTDRTATIAAEYADVRLIEFEKNRGYGAAIKRGFAESTGELVGFLDADGTCDPAFFAELCRAIMREHAEAALGSRMGGDSKMPRLRRLGNRVYAVILSALSNRVVTDTASGMRVIRRDVLEQLYPLPDGMHFTPAMSARVLMDERLRIVERPMPYAERVGESKLHVIRDGMRFLRTIFEMSLMWRPARLFIATAVVAFALMALLASHPIEQWFRAGGFSEDMIYRLLVCSLLGTTGMMFLSAGVLGDHLHRLLDHRRSGPTFWMSVLSGVFTLRGLAVLTVVSTPLLVWLIGPGIWSRLLHGVVVLHWSRFVVAGIIAFALAAMLVTVLLTNVMRFHLARRAAGYERVRGSGHALRTQATPVAMHSKPVEVVGGEPEANYRTAATELISQ